MSDNPTRGKRIPRVCGTELDKMVCLCARGQLNFSNKVSFYSEPAGGSTAVDLLGSFKDNLLR